MAKKILYQGAEAIITKIGNKVIKKRIVKSYRIKILDNRIRKRRTEKEARILQKLKNIIDVPNIVSVDKNNKEITMDFIEGKKLSEYLDKLKNYKKICIEIGKNTAKMHNNDIIHGDLTTSNMIFSEKSNKVYFIDFGLAFHSKRIEDKAVDLHLLKQALEAKHFKKWETYLNLILEGYKEEKEHSKILEQLKKVEARGRYKH
jgi:TP53 regulating kinase-like protein